MEHRLYGIQIERTLRCNLRCKHCGSAAGRARPDELETQELLDAVDDAASLGAQEACILGGEPLLASDWQAVAAACGERGMRVVLITNGWFVDPAAIAGFKAVPGLDRIGVSLDGAHAEVHDGIRGVRGSFRRAIEAMRSLRDAGFEVGAITTLSRDNVGELPALGDLLVDQNITWQIQTASFHGGRFSRDLVISEREFYGVGVFISECRKRYPASRLPVCGSHDIGYFSDRLGYTGELPGWTGCAAGVHTVAIESAGGVKGCLALGDGSVEGNLRERRLRDLWQDPRRFARNRLFSAELLEGSCRGCEHGQECRGGCMSQAHSLTGSVYWDPYCFHRLEREGMV